MAGFASLTGVAREALAAQQQTRRTAVKPPEDASKKKASDLLALASPLYAMRGK
jgi:hypothetical protein